MRPCGLRRWAIVAALSGGPALAGAVSFTDGVQVAVLPASLAEVVAVSPQHGAKLALPQLTLRGSTGRDGTEGRTPGADIAAVQKALGPLVNRLGS